MRSQRHFSKSLLVALLLPLNFVGCSCSFSEYNYEKAEAEAERGLFTEAIRRFESVYLREPDNPYALKSLRQAAKLADYEVKDFKKAVELYKKIQMLSPDPQERTQLQKTIADIYFEKMNDYQASIPEYNKLLPLKLPPDIQLDVRMKISKSHYYLSDFEQAEAESKRAVGLANTDEQKFELELFTANIYFNTKRTDEALAKYRQIVKQFPQLARRENVEMTIVVALEEMQEFDEAISTLESMRPHYPEPDFLDLKVKSLKHRRANMPGSRGLRK